MTVRSDQRKIIYQGNGTTTQFAVPFYFINNTDLQVSVNDGTTTTDLVFGTDYTLTGAGVETGGTLTTAVPVASGSEIAILRTVAYKQEMDIPENDIFPSQNMERALDRLTMQTQQLAEQVDRSVKVDVFSDVDPAFFGLEIETLYAIKDDITTDANNISSINAVAGSMANVNAVGENISNVNAVGENISNVNAVAGNATNIDAVAQGMDDVSLVADNITQLQRIRFGLRKIQFTAAEWVQVGGVYQLQYNKDNIVVAVYRNTDNGSDLMANINIKCLENVNVLFSLAAFDGYMLVADKQEVTTFVYERGTPADTWVITHNLHRFPTVIVMDSDGNEIEKNTVWNSSDQLTVSFNAPYAGRALLN